MTRWNTNYANRGRGLESQVQVAIDFYRAHGIALIQKIPTPIQPVDVDYQRGFIRKAFFEKKSTVDYIGVYKKTPLAFDAKETSADTRFDLNNVKDHQYQFLQFWDSMGGLSFLIVEFTKCGEMYFLSFRVLREYWQGRENGERKSIPYEEFDSEIEPDGMVRVGFLRNIEACLQKQREEAQAS